MPTRHPCVVMGLYDHLISEHFSGIVFSWEYSFDRVPVEREHPDVVIQKMVEGTLMNE